MIKGSTDSNVRPGIDELLNAERTGGFLPLGCKRVFRQLPTPFTFDIR